ncbi:CTP synthase [Candidatus Uhrbacteria bacterium RIFCSPLOWO2_02_FULL_51_9]|uniref:CTP synthase n=1 Tax=Candidatus Uhrbacteria bacterium RIFCSPLOWO2_02_FULL_51_9 TaxID=1802410 RepID=A0A1F7VEU0_9BACT|nr:MAG: CTP synthase [Candidatus Uhrbacteria bacterium RIFCSPLOWO2_02_FULL_51_9]
MAKRKYIFVVGGVMSSVGKGITSASLGALLQNTGLCVTAVKADPYINVDAGTMNPTEHGEVFVTRDGDETDQDMGNYERFLDTELTATNYMTTGRVYQTVIERERSMAYGGKCVEVVPHIPEEIIRRIKDAARVNKADVTIIEIGGTVGEYQNLLFLEAAREMKLRNPKDVVFVLVSYLPIPANVGEMKTKPTQYASRTLNGTGIQADFIVCRGERPIDEPRRRKLATSCGVAPEAIISAPDMPSIYEVPLLLEDAGMGTMVLKRLGMPSRSRTMKEWRVFIKKIQHAQRTVKIAVVGKYFATGDFTLKDSYISVIESLKHSAWFQNCKPELTWIDATVYEKQPSRVKELKGYDGVLVPGGFGSRGIEGIVAAIRFVRERKIPFFGLCYGMQLACVEIARHVAGLQGAHSVEVKPDTKHPIIIANPYQQKNLVNKRYGGTMRLGAYPCVIAPGTRARAAYGSARIEERHRHRYEFNNEYRERLEKAGLVFSGVYPEQNLVEIIELPSHPWFVAVQFHPEFKSRPLRPHPLFRAFIAAAIKRG